MGGAHPGGSSRSCLLPWAAPAHADPLMHGVMTGDHATIVMLMDAVRINQAYPVAALEGHPVSQTPLMAASIRGDVSTVALLLESGVVDVDRPNAEGVTALAAAATAEQSEAVAALLTARASVIAARYFQGVCVDAPPM